MSAIVSARGVGYEFSNGHDLFSNLNYSLETTLSALVEGRAGPFEILRVHEGFTLDLMEQVPQDQVHLAFRLERAAFEVVHRRLIQLNIPFGNGPFDRSGGPAAKSFGAKGMADALYFYDPDEHNIEIRTYESART